MELIISFDPYPNLLTLLDRLRGDKFKHTHVANPIPSITELLIVHAPLAIKGANCPLDWEVSLLLGCKPNPSS